MIKVDADIIEEFVRHTLRFVDRIVVLDNSSPDGAREIVQALVDEGLPVTLWDDPRIGENLQLFGVFARRVFAESDTDYLLLLDADEFIKTESRSRLEAALQQLPEGTHGLIPWMSYVPTIDDDASEDRVLRRIRHRLVRESSQYYKVVVDRSFQASASATIARGSHAVEDPAGFAQMAQLDGVSLGHFPVRSIAQVQRKALLGWNTYLSMGHREDEMMAYQWRKLYQKLRAGSDWTAQEFLQAGMHYLDEDDGDAELVLDPIAPVPCTYTLPDRGLLSVAIEYMRDLAISFARLSSENRDLQARADRLLQAPLAEASALAHRVTATEVKRVYRAFLQRDPENRATVDHYIDNELTLGVLLHNVLSSHEFAERRERSAGPSLRDYDRHNGEHYLSPRELRGRDTEPSRVLLLGQCQVESFVHALRRAEVKTPVDFMLVVYNPPPPPPHPFEEYAFQIVQIPFRAVLPDSEYSEWLRTPYDDRVAASGILERACQRIDVLLPNFLQWADRIPAFVMNFLTPQYDATGRYFHEPNASSSLFLVQEINRHLRSSISGKHNVYLLDQDHCAGVFGRRFIQDDSIWNMTHRTLFGDYDFDLDQGRIVRAPAASEHYSIHDTEFIGMLWREAEAMYLSLRQVDAVKMVCVDLDDTIWRGVLAESEDVEPIDALEGWPLGIVEALLALRRRGIILALTSKNEASRIEELWPRVFADRLRMDDFAILKINWDSKVQNIQEAMLEANVLPRNVVFLDDSPIERASVKQAFPEMRVIDAPHYYWKRILLWSAETQSSTITAESARRSDMIKSQVRREAQRKTLSREEFLRTLDLQARFSRVAGRDDRLFARTLELLNKTNQFNTTGRRWSAIELDQACGKGTVLVCEVADRHADYGLVLVAIAEGATIEQLVMSCRVIGLDVEVAAVTMLAEIVLADHPRVTSVLRETDANLPSRDLFQKCGWRLVDGQWQTESPGVWPAHILSVSASGASLDPRASA